jgi:cytochrome d ubiquinol oxidase subunit I
MQTPAGFHIVGEGIAARAEITNFWEMVFNPSSMERLAHVLGGAWLAGAFLVISVSAYYLLKNRHIQFARTSLSIGLIMAVVASLFQLLTGHLSAEGVSENQPAKLAAMEGHFDSEKPGTLYILGWVDEENNKTYGIGIPGFLSLMVHGDFSKPVIGLDKFPATDRPQVNWVFQTYHIMVAIGMALIAISVLAIWLNWRGKLINNKFILKILVLSVLGPQIANQTGWYTAEMGRQPWIVYGLLRTSDALSKTVSAEHVLFSLVLFLLIYSLLFVLFLFLLDRKIKHGPQEIEEISDEYAQQKYLFQK